MAELYARDHELWIQARDILVDRLVELVDIVYRDSDPSRARVGASRLKSRESTLDKAQRLMPPSVDIAGLDRREAARAVQAVVPDLVGLRVIVKTLRDVAIVARAVTAECSGNSPIQLVGVPTDYIAHPKASGYRSVHILLSVPVSKGPVTRRVGCEVQIRTMLQDAWGELTHENSYKTGEHALPDLYLAIAKHMADMLHQVDELAQTLAVETDALLEALVETENAGSEHALAGRNSLLDDAEYSGRVVSSGPNYALILIGSRRGLLSAASLKEALGISGYVQVHDYLKPGDTVRVTVLEQDDTEQRLILAPADPDSLR